MSYLKFSSNSPVASPVSVFGYFGWPVKAIPIQFWETSSEAFDLLEETTIRLMAAGIKSEGELIELLGIPAIMSEMVRRTTKQLQSKGLLSRDLHITEQGLTAVYEKELWHKNFKQGWVFLDQIRGFIFPFVQAGRLTFHESSNVKGLNLTNLISNELVIQKDRLQNQTLTAISAYNRRRVLLESLDTFNNLHSIEYEREFDEPILAVSDREIEDFSLFPLEYSQDHFLIIPISGEILRGSDRILFHSYSPFSSWEQDLYLKVIQEKASEHDNLRQALQSLEKLARQKQAKLIEHNLDDVELIKSALEKNLSDCKLPSDLLDQIWTLEYHKLNFVFSKDKGIQDRAVIIMDYARCLENTFDLLATEINNWRIPSLPEYGEEIFSWYQRKVDELGKSPSWMNLPPGLKSNLKTTAKKLPGQYGDIRCASGRDRFVKLMLCLIAYPDPMLPNELRKLSHAIEHDPNLFSALDFSFDWRNDAAHRSIKINQLSDEEFRSIQESVEKCMYGILNTIYGN